MTVRELEIARSIVGVAKHAEALGLVRNAQGNFSVRLPGERAFLITPHGIPYTELTPEDLVVADLEGHKSRGMHAPSTETEVHALAYRRHAGVGACVHVEPDYINVLTVLNRPIPNVLGNFVYLFAGRGLAVGPSLRSGNVNFAAASLEAMGDRFGVVWKNHGVFCIGPDLDSAFDRCVAAEQAARVYYLTLALQLGEPDLVPLDVQAEMIDFARSSSFREAI
ncbi:MAG TPA: class II aldolase/adducin family protein [Acidimicrobiales bacterium]|nr:class II aldolase/adducin family protein [Acidimicrobiales bacterium]